MSGEGHSAFKELAKVNQWRKMGVSPDTMKLWPSAKMARKKLLFECKLCKQTNKQTKNSWFTQKNFEIAPQSSSSMCQRMLHSPIEMDGAYL